MSSLSDSGRLRSPKEGRRYVLAGLLRALMQPDRPELDVLIRQAFVRLRELLPKGSLVLFIELTGTPAEARLITVSGDPKDTELLPRERFPASRLGFLGSQAWLCEPYRIEVVHGALPQPSVLESALRKPVSSVIAAPMLLGPDQTGVLTALLSGGEDAFSEANLELLQRVADPLRSLFRRHHGLEDGVLLEADRQRYAATLTGCPRIDLAECKLDEALVDRVGGGVLLRYQVFPLEDLGSGRMRAAVVDPLDWHSQDEFESVSGYRLAERCLAPAKQIRDGLQSYLEAKALEAGAPPDPLAELAIDLQPAAADPEAEEEDEISEESVPVVRLASQLIREAHAAGASDIHVECHETQVLVRFRVDGVCRDRLVLPTSVARPLVARLKVMSDLDIAEHRLPQDGRLEFARFDSELDIDLRVSVLPMLHGECVVLRLLDRSSSRLPLEALGFSEHNMAQYRQVIASPFGMILHCGPTGSGKSTSLFAALNEINDPRWKIVTAEDPIEYTLDGINQLQVKPQIGLTFAASLRCFLRHDPDVILVGEIRDGETAKIATEAALTGHLLLSTLHTNDAATSVSRLERLGIEPFLVGSSLIAVCAQRLLRRVCTCGSTREPDAQALSLLRRAKDGKPPSLVPVSLGCEACHHSGYRGRTGVHELLVVGSRIRQHIGDRASAEVLKLAARKQGMRTLFEDAMAKVNAGMTTLDEALRVTRPDELG